VEKKKKIMQAKNEDYGERWHARDFTTPANSAHTNIQRFDIQLS